MMIETYPQLSLCPHSISIAQELSKRLKDEESLRVKEGNKARMDKEMEKRFRDELGKCAPPLSLHPFDRSVSTARP